MEGRAHNKIRADRRSTGRERAMAAEKEEELEVGKK